MPHALKGIDPLPTSSEAVKATMKGIRRTRGAMQARKAPATHGVIDDMIASCPETLRGTRDHALLLLGFAGAAAILHLPIPEHVEGLPPQLGSLMRPGDRSTGHMRPRTCPTAMATCPGRLSRIEPSECARPLICAAETICIEGGPLVVLLVTTPTCLVFGGDMGNTGNRRRAHLIFRGFSERIRVALHGQRLGNRGNRMTWSPAFESWTVTVRPFFDGDEPNGTAYGAELPGLSASGDAHQSLRKKAAISRAARSSAS